MKILYAGPLDFGGSCYYRLLALKRLGHEVVSFDTSEYIYKNALLHYVSHRLAAGPRVIRLNRNLLRIAQDVRPQIFWADKALSLFPSTLRAIKALGAKTVSYMIDNAFGPRRDPGWRLYLKNLGIFDLHVTQRDVSVRDYLIRGAANVLKIQTAFEPTIHFPPEKPIPDAEKIRGISFIGTPYDNRADIITQLHERGFSVSISGRRRSWERALRPEVFNQVYRGGELWEDRYREAIWHSKVNLSFITHSNQDEYAHKSFEIAGCEGFLLCERSVGHSLKFLEDVEAVFFAGVDELAQKLSAYLPNVERRAQIAKAGRLRAVRDGYDNDTQMARVIDAIKALPPR